MTIQDPLETLSVYKADSEKSRRLTAIEQLSQTRYIFNPDNDLDMRNRQVGFAVLPRVRLMPIVNYTTLVAADPMMQSDNRVREHVIYAQYVAAELVSVYSHLGVIEIEDFVGLLPLTVKEIQKLLMPDLPATTQQLVTSLELIVQALQAHQYTEALNRLSVAHKVTQLEGKCIRAYQAMLDSARNALVFQNNYLKASIEDRKNHLQTGKTHFDVRDQKYAKLLAIELPDALPEPQDAIASVVEKAIQAASTSSHEQVRTLVTEIISQIFDRAQAREEKQPLTRDALRETMKRKGEL